MLLDVVPYVGTWIEIITLGGVETFRIGRSLRGNVDRNLPMIPPTVTAQGRSLRGNVDRNTSQRIYDDAGLLSFPTWERG